MANINEPDFSDASLNNADFTRASMNGVNFSTATLTGALNFNQAQLCNITFAGVRGVTQSNLAQALKGAKSICKVTMPDGSQNMSGCDSDGECDDY
ncbi:pentapeptide repeat-containing protein [Piscirickettsia litoralis]|uniref:Pentapeptide repeat-containing protein n=1 Tax=Piscirickettsia litoralis TaxID=1891921 RepID=A0ABX2ZZ55_9GAMM|nr:pentapeptide repeat-containing protein [Piscirickettsia litoralis]ODN41899.1 hypothetical protein BGC07_01625 [Piscirickettsia litoralis]